MKNYLFKYNHDHTHALTCTYYIDVPPKNVEISNDRVTLKRATKKKVNYDDSLNYNITELMRYSSGESQMEDSDIEIEINKKCKNKNKNKNKNRKRNNKMRNEKRKKTRQDGSGAEDNKTRNDVIKLLDDSIMGSQYSVGNGISQQEIDEYEKFKQRRKLVDICGKAIRKGKKDNENDMNSNQVRDDSGDRYFHSAGVSSLISASMTKILGMKSSVGDNNRNENRNENENDECNGIRYLNKDITDESKDLCDFNDEKTYARGTSKVAFKGESVHSI